MKMADNLKRTEPGSFFHSACAKHFAPVLENLPHQTGGKVIVHCDPKRGYVSLRSLLEDIRLQLENLQSKSQGMTHRIPKRTHLKTFGASEYDSESHQQPSVTEKFMEGVWTALKQRGLVGINAPVPRDATLFGLGFDCDFVTAVRKWSPDKSPVGELVNDLEKVVTTGCSPDDPQELILLREKVANAIAKVKEAYGVLI
jgi:hypothetical protein